MSYVIPFSQTMAAMLNDGDAEDDRLDVVYTCRICLSHVLKNEPTEIESTIRACRNCKAKRLEQLVKAEQDLIALRYSQRTEWLKVATLAQLHVGDLAEL